MKSCVSPRSRCSSPTRRSTPMRSKYSRIWIARLRPRLVASRKAAAVTAPPCAVGHVARDVRQPRDGGLGVVQVLHHLVQFAALRQPGQRGAHQRLAFRVARQVAHPGAFEAAQRQRGPDLLRQPLFGGRQAHAVFGQVHEGAARATRPSASRPSSSCAPQRLGQARQRQAAQPRGVGAGVVGVRGRGRPPAPPAPGAWASRSAARPAPSCLRTLAQTHRAVRRHHRPRGAAAAGPRPAAPPASKAAWRAGSAGRASAVQFGQALGRAAVACGRQRVQHHAAGQRARGRGVAQHHAVAPPGRQRLLQHQLRQARCHRVPALSGLRARPPAQLAAPRCTCTGVPLRSGLGLGLPQRQRARPGAVAAAPPRAATSHWPRVDLVLGQRRPAPPRSAARPPHAAPAGSARAGCARARAGSPGTSCSSSPTCTAPACTVPVTTVPTPSSVKARSTASRKAWPASLRAGSAAAASNSSVRSASMPCPGGRHRQHRRALPAPCPAAAPAPRPARLHPRRVGTVALGDGHRCRGDRPSSDSTARCSRVCGITPSSAATSSSAEVDAGGAGSAWCAPGVRGRARR
jgi:hypothetical protein